MKNRAIEPKNMLYNEPGKEDARYLFYVYPT